MANWSETLAEIEQEIANGNDAPAAMDIVRRRYLQLLQQHTGRPTICYYSGWLQKPGFSLSGIDDNDKNAFMATIHGLERDKGLDLLLHTPGGDSAATESLVNYLRKIFGPNMRAFVPQIAMSAGTVIACACREIWMGKQSNIGPIDPQLRGMPAHGIIDEFNRAIAEVTANPASAPIWTTIIARYHPTLLADCQHAIDMSSGMLEKQLITGMFEGDPDAAAKASAIAAKLNNHTDTKAHNRHIHMEEAAAIGLKVQALEQDQKLQDLVLTVHHAYMLTLANTMIGKIVENHLGIAMTTYQPMTK